MGDEMNTMTRMFSRLCALSCLAFSTPALAEGGNELSLTMGGIPAPADNFELFSEAATLGGWGARGGVELSDRWSLVAGYQRSVVGTRSGAVDS